MVAVYTKHRGVQAGGKYFVDRSVEELGSVRWWHVGYLRLDGFLSWIELCWKWMVVDLAAEARNFVPLGICLITKITLILRNKICLYRLHNISTLS